MTPPGAPIVDGGDVAGLRLCIGAQRGFKTIAAALAEVLDAMRAVV